MDFLGIPVWLFVLMMSASVVTGLIIRFWLDRRKARQEQARVLRQKEEKKQAKRAHKLARKAAKSRKDSKKAKAEGATEADTGRTP